jgi:hypothetical protein
MQNNEVLQRYVDETGNEGKQIDGLHGDGSLRHRDRWMNAKMMVFYLESAALPTSFPTGYGA